MPDVPGSILISSLVVPVEKEEVSDTKYAGVLVVATDDVDDNDAKDDVVLVVAVLRDLNPDESPV